MSEIIQLIFEGQQFKPRSKQHGRSQGRYGSYPKKTYLEFKLRIADEAKLQLAIKYGIKRPIDTDKSLEVKASVIWPQSFSDVADNLMSGYWDALEGVLYETDAMIDKAEITAGISTDTPDAKCVIIQIIQKPASPWTIDAIKKHWQRLKAQAIKKLKGARR